MKLRFILLASLLLVLVVASNAVAATPTAPTTTPSLTQGSPDGSTPAPGPDPFYGLDDLHSKAVPVAFCRCLIGTNCCGDPGVHGNKCSLQGSGCTCNANNDCVH